MEQMPNEYLERIVQVEQRSKSNTHAIQEIKEDQSLLRKMVENVGVIAEQTKTTSEKVSKLSDDVETLKHSETSRKTKEEECEEREKDFKIDVNSKLEELSKSIDEIQKIEENRKLREENEQARKSNFNNTFLGKLLYKIAEAAILGVLTFLFTCVYFYIKTKYLG